MIFIMLVKTIIIVRLFLTALSSVAMKHAYNNIIINYHVLRLIIYTQTWSTVTLYMAAKEY